MVLLPRNRFKGIVHRRQPAHFELLGRRTRRVAKCQVEERRQHAHQFARERVGHDRLDPAHDRSEVRRFDDVEIRQDRAQGCKRGLAAARGHAYRAAFFQRRLAAKTPTRSRTARAMSAPVWCKISCSASCRRDGRQVTTPSPGAATVRECMTKPVSLPAMFNSISGDDLTTGLVFNSAKLWLSASPSVRHDDQPAVAELLLEVSQQGAGEALLLLGTQLGALRPRPLSCKPKPMPISGVNGPSTIGGSLTRPAVRSRTESADR